MLPFSFLKLPIPIFSAINVTEQIDSTSEDNEDNLLIAGRFL